MENIQKDKFKPAATGQAIPATNERSAKFLNDNRPHSIIQKKQAEALVNQPSSVLQQGQAGVKPCMQRKSNVNSNDDNTWEKEANGVAAKVWLPGPVQFIPDRFANYTTHDVIQRRLIVGSTDYSKEVEDGNHTLEEAIAHIKQQINNDATVKRDIELWFAIGSHQAKIERQLYKWIENAPGTAHASFGKSHPDFGRKQQNRKYANWYDLALALVGWVKAKGGRHREKNLANQVYANDAQQAVLNGLLLKLYFKITTLHEEGVVDAKQQQNIITELTSSLTISDQLGHREPIGHYKKYHEGLVAKTHKPSLGTRIGNDQLDVLKNPLNYSIKDKVVLLHDLMEYFGQHQHWNPKTSGEGILAEPTHNETRVTTAVDFSGKRSASISVGEQQNAGDKDFIRGKGLTSSSRHEQAPNTKLARKYNLPIWASQSLTTARMLKLAQWAGADTPELAAVALSVFAYWRKDYDHTSDLAYHTLFEVLDIAQNFGVDYTINPGSSDTKDVTTLEKGIANAELKYQELLTITLDLRRRADELHIRGQAKMDVDALFQQINFMDARVRLAHAIAKGFSPDNKLKAINLHHVLTGLVNGAEIQRKISKKLEDFSNQMDIDE